MRFFLFTMAILISSSNAFARPLYSKRVLTAKDFFSLELEGNFNYKGIAALNNCSGSLVRFETTTNSELAMILTNGHCYEGGYIPIDQAVVHQASSRTFSLLSDDGQQRLGKVRATELIYGTMTKSDFSFYLLNETYEQILAKYNVTPLTVLRRPAQQGENLELISGYWKRGWNCSVDAIIPNGLEEAGWRTQNSIRYTPECKTMGGTSGSPLLQAGTRNIIGINSTGAEGGEACAEGNPCEIDEHGNKQVLPGRNYGEQINWIYACMDERNQLNLNLPSCELPQ